MTAMDLGFHTSATVPAFERMLDPSGRWRQVHVPVRFGLMRHPKVGPVLIDTGYSAHALQAPGRSALLRGYGRLLRARLRPEGQLEAVLAAEGLAPADIAAVVLTHLHADHVSGLTDLAQARIYVSAAALTQAERPRAALHGVFPELLPTDLRARATLIEDLPRIPQPLGLPDGADLFGDGSLFAVPLAGHAAGHFGVRLPAEGGAGFLYAADADWLRQTLGTGALPPRPLRWILDDAAGFLASKSSVAAFAAGGGDVLLCHQPEPHPRDAGT